MEIESNKWKILQTDNSDYILLSSNDEIQKIKGNNATTIVDVLNNLQSNLSFEEAKLKLLNSYDKDLIDNVIEWLEFNKFLKLKKNQEKPKINIIGEFSENDELLLDFIKNLPAGVEINKVFNLSVSDVINIGNGNEITILIAPFWYNQDNIIKISEIIVESKNDFLYVELYNNGIALGPLMNYSKGTACLNCLEERKMFNFSNPNLIIENILDKEIISHNKLNVFEIGSYDLNKAFLYNELSKIVVNDNRTLYNKSVFIDLNKYENTLFNVIKTPNCKVCSPKTNYNPL